ncbi:PadR family transcriptional regulator [Neobacillus novalis]|uniref:PadR family transcriptional regulator n=2 Tax=Neobacillus novalis TaxID=220687 RepID=A0AA95SBP6_9BACI|nr:PadR family transcriptional regulator [Neobacillus novalis]WHY86789.1 PadR family transcriptional regulator [Neobacillus novalis]
MANDQRAPMTEAMYYVLLALYNPLHGYAVMDEVKKVSNGRIIMGPGTLYGILKRMQQENFIVLDELDGRRKIYHITENGREALKHEHQRLTCMVDDGKPLLGNGDSNGK